MTVALLLLASLVVAGCAGNNVPGGTASDTSGAVTTRTPIPDTLHIPLGEERRTDGGRLAITFIAVVADSRCPANALCVWEGDASVRLRLQSAGAALDTVLHTRLQPVGVDFAHYRLSVPGLFPYPGTWEEGARPPPASVLVGVARR